MSNIFNRRWLRFALVGAIAMAPVGLPKPAAAITVYCTNCSTTFQQALQVAREIETALNTARQLSTQINQYNDMIKQGRALPSTILGRMTGDIQRLQNLHRQAKTLYGSIEDFDSTFRKQFKDYDSYLAQSGKGTDHLNDTYKRWNEEGFESIRVAMRASGMNVSALDDEDELLAQMVHRSQTSEGRLQAIQAGNEIAAQQVQQVMKLRQLIDTQIQSQSMWYAQNLERQTIGDAARQTRKATPIQRGGAKGY